jgi:predicted TIM-barrel fold metal-dependent hydrolase
MLIDVHQHVGSVAAFFSTVRDEPGEQRDGPRRRAANTQFGITYAVMQPAFEYPTTQGAASVRAVNDEIARYVSENDFAVAGLGVVDPLSMDDAASEANRIVSDLHLAGISWHTRFQRMPTNALPIFDIIEACPSSTRVIGVHCVAESTLEAPWRLESLLEAFPERRFLALSSLTGPSQSDEMIEICRRRPNLYLDTAGLSPLGLWIERLVAKVGSDRLLFGTDLYLNPPLFRHNYAFQSIEAAHISDLDRERIYNQNAKELFGLIVS